MYEIFIIYRSVCIFHFHMRVAMIFLECQGKAAGFRWKSPTRCEELKCSGRMFDAIKGYALTQIVSLFVFFVFVENTPSWWRLVKSFWYCRPSIISKSEIGLQTSNRIKLNNCAISNLVISHTPC